MPQSVDPNNNGVQKSSVARASGIISSFTFLSRILGLVRDMVISAYFGAGQSADAFFVAFKLPNLLRRLVAEGSLSSAFVPLFSEELSKSRSDAQQAIKETVSYCLLLTGLLTVLGMVFADTLTEIFAPGFGVGTEKFDLAVTLLQIMFPYTVLISLSALASGILNSLGRFALPAMTPVFLNICLISSILIFGGFFENPIFALAMGVILGGFAQLIPLTLQLGKIGYRFTLASPFKSPVVRKLIFLMGPAVFSASIYQVMIFVNTLLASLLEDGSVSWLYYADRLFQFPLGVFSVAIATAVLPELSRLAVANKKIELNEQLTKTICWVTFITLPATAGLIVLSETLVVSIYEHGAFTHQSSIQTANCLIAFSIGLWAISCQTVLVRAFLAKKNTKLPAYISSVTLFFNVLASLALMGESVQKADTALASWIINFQNYIQFFSLGTAGLALAGSISTLFSALLLFLLLKRIDVEIDIRKFFVCISKTLLASFVMAISIWCILQIEMNVYLELLISIVVGIAVFYFVSLVLKTNEISETNKVLTKLRSRFSNGNK